MKIIRTYQGFLIFIALCCIYGLLNFVADKHIYTDEYYYNLLGEKLNFERIEKIINNKKENIWFGYILIPIIYIIKFTLIAGILSIGLFFILNRFEFKKAFYLAIIAEYIFLIPALLKLLWFLVIQTDYQEVDLQSFYPLSSLNFFDYQSLDKWLLYPLKLLNLFEVTYWFVLAYGIAKIIKQDLASGMKVVLASYGAGLVLWVALVMFLTVNLGI